MTSLAPCTNTELTDVFYADLSANKGSTMALHTVLGDCVGINESIRLSGATLVSIHKRSCCVGSMYKQRMPGLVFLNNIAEEWDWQLVG